jgi:CheY-like chemotaxis protein
MTNLPNRKLSGVYVAVVDDYEDNLSWIRLVLELEGATVFTALSAFKALDVLEHERVDVLITDLGLPVLDGYQLLAAIRERCSGENTRVPVIAMSGLTSEAECALAREAGFAAYVVKPVLAETIVAAVADLVSR